MKKRAALITALLLLAAGILLYCHDRNRQRTAPDTGGTALTARPISHVVVIVEENKPADSIIGNSAAPYLNRLLKTGALAQNYHALTHPSLPNYIALTSGTTAGISSDCNPSGSKCRANVPNIADTIEQSGHSWKEYAEDMPTSCNASNAGLYAVRHNPFMYYPGITSDSTRCASHVVPFSQFSRDLSGHLPDFSFITPNLCNDMHNCSVQTGDAWLAQQVPLILKSAAFTRQHSLLVITWDEGEAGDNRVPAIFAGPAARPGYTSGARYSHYSLLHTLEVLWNLPPLTQNDRSAPVMNDMLQ